MTRTSSSSCQQGRIAAVQGAMTLVPVASVETCPWKGLCRTQGQNVGADASQRLSSDAVEAQWDRPILRPMRDRPRLQIPVSRPVIDGGA
jgi:hypothetical protein